MQNQTPARQPQPIPRHLYRPNSTPWTAKRGGTERLVWYCILDTYGDEVCNTGSVLLDDEDQMLSQVLLILSKVNDTDVVTIDGKEVRVTWK